MYRKILLPTDGSAGSRNAERHALNLAKTYGAELHLLYVLDTEAYREGSKTSNEEKQKGREVLERIEDDAERHDIDTVLRIKSGIAHEEILDYSEKQDIDMIVMGTNARRGIKKLVLGSVTEEVVESSSVPVVTVNKKKKRVGSAEAAVKRAERVLKEEGYTKIEILDGPFKEYEWVGDDAVADSWEVKAETNEGEVTVEIEIGTGEVEINSV